MGTALVLLVFGYALPAAAFAGEVPPGTTAGGVDSGGLSPRSAEERLRRELAAQTARSLTVESADTSVAVQFWSTKRFDIRSKSSARHDVRGFATRSGSGPDCIPMPGAEGLSIDAWRIFVKDGEVVRNQKFHTVYALEPRLTCS
ncbi:hypothetical protein [Planomonospora parontospora]|uniref:hypothetical protein n=1 Tax=Planomonospora parontospora TaxID=58119 RepID=UPI0016706836|nr:hypothetical protein [Planomonospora parontospora]GGL59179.1 hypothetical protein GCM10014719_70750 [Planomonospora parontospora subsp. antibiotica]GII20296.1 hypothetical protein Ppa05_70220 [Planomonospora parontospora subsp. antibiotica]